MGYMYCMGYHSTRGCFYQTNTFIYQPLLIYHFCQLTQTVIVDLILNTVKITQTVAHSELVLQVLLWHHFIYFFLKK